VKVAKNQGKCKRKNNVAHKLSCVDKKETCSEHQVLQNLVSSQLYQKCTLYYNEFYYLSKGLSNNCV